MRFDPCIIRFYCFGGKYCENQAALYVFYFDTNGIFIPFEMD